MKKLLLSLIFLSTIASIKTDTAINETEFAESNNQFIRAKALDKKNVKDKTFLDFSINVIGAGITLLSLYGIYKLIGTIVWCYAIEKQTRALAKVFMKELETDLNRLELTEPDLKKVN